MIKSGRIGAYKAWELILFHRQSYATWYAGWQWRRKGQDHPGINVTLEVPGIMVLEFSWYDVRHADEIEADGAAN